MKSNNPKTAVDIMSYLAKKYFENRCFVTHEKFRNKGFVIHHLWYIEGDVKRSQFPNTVKGRNDYMTALQPLVEMQPYRFVLIKNGIHTRIDHPRNGLSRMKRDNFSRLCVAVLLTKKERKK